PDPEKTEGLRDLADAVGTRLARGQLLRPHHFNAVLAHVHDTADEKMVNEAVLRSQAKAVYSIDNLGHFGLALRHYAHFTSPIRRYADLLVHRSIVDMLASGAAPRDGLGGRQAFDLVDDCTHISETEGRTAAAERRTIDRFAAALFAGRKGKVVPGVVAGVTGAGAFVSLDGGAADGFLPARTLPDDYYTLDRSGMRMVGRHNGMALGIGDSVDVLVVDVTPVNGGILLSYVDGGGTAKRSGRGGKPRKAKAGAGKPKRGAKAKARGKTGARGGKKSGKARRSR
ncbi:MAG: RNB domain-containing ribonuclease, partial [Pseudomonadota bacterium]|nr:RNB domain-containing ribonuclease [Pseudomonadota bacterium]